MNISKYKRTYAIIAFFIVVILLRIFTNLEYSVIASIFLPFFAVLPDYDKSIGTIAGEIIIFMALCLLFNWKFDLPAIIVVITGGVITTIGVILLRLFVTKKDPVQAE